MSARRGAARLIPVLALLAGCEAAPPPEGAAAPTGDAEAERAAIEARIDQNEEAPLFDPETGEDRRVFDEIRPPEPLPEPKLGQDWAEIAQALLAAGDPEQAIRAYQLALADEGATERVMTGLAAAHFRARRVTEARRILERAVEAHPRSVVARTNLGVVYYALREYQGARAAFLQARELAGGADPSIERNLALVETAIEMQTGDGTAPADLAAEPAFKVVRLGGGRYVLEPVETDP